MGGLAAHVALGLARAARDLLRLAALLPGAARARAPARGAAARLAARLLRQAASIGARTRLQRTRRGPARHQYLQHKQAPRGKVHARAWHFLCLVSAAPLLSSPLSCKRHRRREARLVVTGAAAALVRGRRGLGHRRCGARRRRRTPPPPAGLQAAPPAAAAAARRACRHRLGTSAATQLKLRSTCCEGHRSHVEHWLCCVRPGVARCRSGALTKVAYVLALPRAH